MAPHAGFSRHVLSQRSPSPAENTSMDSVPDGASGALAGRYQMLNPSPLVPTSDWLPMELTLPEYLRSVTGVEDLTQLRHLKLRVITGEASIQRISIYAPSLVHLDLQGSCIGSLRDLGCGLVALEVLSVSRCGLNSLDGTYGFPSLKDFTASFNKIKDVGPCSAIENLRFLDVRGNQISDIGCIGFLYICPKLEELVLMDCPVTREPHYRRRVLEMLPSLITLDMHPFTDFVLSPDDDSEEDEDEEAEEAIFEKEWEEEEDNRETELRLEADKKKAEGASVDDRYEEEETVPRSSATSEAEDECVESNADRPVKRIPSRKSRPASAAARLQTWSVMNPSMATSTRKKRPQTARQRSHRSGAGEGDSSDRNPLLVSQESPSSLTSGVAMCGNIAAALLSNRSWSRASGESGMSKPLEEPTEVRPTTDIHGMTPDSFRDDILEASRKWREAYTRFRQNNRVKWEKEAEEEDKRESEVGEGTGEGAAGDEEEVTSVHVFRGSDPPSDLSYDASISSNTE